ncbi:hypothetical protein [Flavobacterium sp. 3HN19-14]|uniref:hypothetical protein n=1 Tax=Flavobacterium sp. 3HN19-14 TaxID=3448133 RepID=UPI003EE3AEB2
MSKTAILFFALLAQMLFAQEDKLLSGKIVVKDASPEGVHIINLVNEKEAVSNNKGHFSIMGKPDDVLVFSAMHLDLMRRIISEEDYKIANMIVEMTSKVTELDVVEINTYKNINAVDLGILKKLPKSYTPAERRLKAASSFDPSMGVGGMIGAALTIDPVINWISGRTKLLRAELEVEKKEILLRKLSDMFEEKYFTEILKIPPEYVIGFEYYCVEDEKMTEAINSKNAELVAFTAAELAITYLSLINEENK